MSKEGDIEKEPESKEDDKPKAPTPTSDEERKTAQENQVVKETQQEASALKDDVKGK